MEITINKEIRDTLSVEELSQRLNAMLSNTEKSEELLQAAVKELETFKAEFAAKKYEFKDMDIKMRNFISSIIDDTETSIDQINLMIDAYEFWNGKECAMTRDIFDYTNKCLVSKKFKGYDDIKLVKQILETLSDANKEFAKDAIYNDYLVKKAKALNDSKE